MSYLFTSRSGVHFRASLSKPVWKYVEGAPHTMIRVAFGPPSDGIVPAELDLRVGWEETQRQLRGASSRTMLQTLCRVLR